MEHSSGRPQAATVNVEPSDALTVGRQVMFAEDEHNTTSLGVVSRVWPNGKYVSVICDGHLYVRLIERVRMLSS